MCIRLLFVGITLLLFVRTLDARDRKPFAQLSSSDKSVAESCDRVLKAMATTRDVSEREREAKDLLDSAKKLNSSEPDYFKGWLWRAHAALVLNLKEEGLVALENMVELGVSENKDPRILGVVYLIHKRGWTTADTSTADTSTADTSTADTSTANTSAAEPTTTQVSSTTMSASESMRGERYPETRLRPLSESDIANMSKDELRYAINEMYARHGLTFHDKSYQAKFERYEWYKPDADLTMDQVEDAFTDIERDNVKLLGDRRNSLANE